MSDFTNGSQRFRVGDLEIHAGTFAVARAGVLIDLPKRSYDLLMALIRAAPNAVSTDDLIEQVWNGAIVNPETVTQRVRLLRQAIGDDAREPKYIGLVRGRGYRLLLNVEFLDTPDESQRPGRFALRWQVALLGIGLAFLLFFWLRTTDEPSATLPAERAEKSIAVLPFASIGDTTENVFSKGIPEAILHKLSNIEQLVVISRTSSFAFEDANLDAGEIGRELGARYILEGSVLQTADRLDVNARLIDTADSSYVWSFARRASVGDVFDVNNEIVLEIGSALQLTLLDEERSKVLAHGTESVPAYIAYSRGMAALDELSLNESIAAQKHFEDAIALDSEFARAWLGLASVDRTLTAFGALSREEGMSRTRNHVDKALARDPTLGVAYLLLASEHQDVFSSSIDGRYENKVRELIATAVENDPESPEVLRAQARIRCPDRSRDIDCQRDKARLISEAMRRDPESPRSYASLAWVHFELNETDRAYELVRESIRRGPHFVYGYWSLAALHWGGPDIDWVRSLSCLQTAVAVDPNNVAMKMPLAALYVDLGMTTEADKVLRSVVDPHRRFQSWMRYIRFSMMLRERKVEEALVVAEQLVDTVGAHDDQAFPVYLAFAEHHAKGGDARSGIERLSAVFEQNNTRLAQYDDGAIRGRTAAFAALALASMLREIGESPSADRLVADSRELFEREIAADSPWVSANTVAYALSLLMSGDSQRALLELEKLPDTYLRRAWMLNVDPVFAQLRGDPRFAAVNSRIDSRIASFRDQIATDSGALPDCIPHTRPFETQRVGEFR